MHKDRQVSVFDQKRASLQALQDRIRDPSLTILLVLQLFLLFVALPLDAGGVPIAEPLGISLLLLVLTVVVMLSRRGVAIVIILFGLAATGASIALGREWWPIAASVLNHGGIILSFSALIWVVTHAVYAPGRITLHRLQGAVVVYLSFAMMFEAAFSLIWELIPGAFTNLPAAPQGPREVAMMLYFSLGNLTTNSYGDILPINLFARSVAYLETILGQFYIAITIARLVTLELEDRRRSRE
ncbi:MAG TPA: ion channel [Acetobacteraceae bacterium]|nr:ion channel [Acetobacteraceae bacterium]